MTNNEAELREQILSYVEAAYLHGLCVENLDTGELEPPKDISEVEWIADKLQSLITEQTRKARIDELERINGESVYSDYRKRKDQLIGISIEARLAKLRRQVPHHKAEE